MQQVRQQVKESWANMALGWQFLWELWAKSCWMWRSLTLNIVIQKWQPRTNTYLGPLVAEISHGRFRLLGRCCVVFCCWLSIPKNTFILAAQREIFFENRMVDTSCCYRKPFFLFHHKLKCNAWHRLVARILVWMIFKQESLEDAWPRF